LKAREERVPILTVCIETGVNIPFADVDLGAPWVEVVERIGYSRSFSEMVKDIPTDITVRELLDTLDDARLAEQIAQEQEGVAILTAHAAKGLEFDHVIIPGVTEGIWPNKRSDPMEEMRLFYVAVTRARKSVLITVPEIVAVPFGAPEKRAPSALLAVTEGARA